MEFTAKPSAVDIRELLLEAAVRVYAEVGTRGATTRRIAHEAGVNEVSLFRHFGSKEQLIREALGLRAHAALPGRLPDRPIDPPRELEDFAREYHAALYAHRSIVRKTMGEFEEHPDVCSIACERPRALGVELAAYLETLRHNGLAGGSWSASAAAGMLMGTLFADALGRDCMPELYGASETDAIQEYVRLFLTSIGATGSTR
ncbi:MAG: TetR/AcrR family transcriptional regulator [Vicinamibacterales bacterium]